MIDKTKANFNVFTCESYIQLDIKLNIILKILRKILSFKVGVQRATVAFALFPLLYNSIYIRCAITLLISNADKKIQKYNLRKLWRTCSLTYHTPDVKFHQNLSVCEKARRGFVSVDNQFQT